MNDHEADSHQTRTGGSKVRDEDHEVIYRRLQRASEIADGKQTAVHYRGLIYALMQDDAQYL